jgi:ABC-2 type transport system ATP-binding protein
MTMPIAVSGLTKIYGASPAIRGIDFEVRPGEVFGLLGPNGAGKTSTLEILEGLRSRTGGEVSVLGMDPGAESRRLKDSIGVCLQATFLPWNIKVGEAIYLFGNLYSRRLDGQALLARLGLADRRDSFYSALSGGQKQRLVFALALLNDPRLLFLDEPSTGLDPQIRLEIHELIAELKREGRTILLTTHYIEEAEKLCDRVAIMNEGRIIATGTPEELRATSQGHSVIQIRCQRPLGEPGAVPLQPGDRLQVSADGTAITIHAPEAARTLTEVVKWMDQQGLDPSDVTLKRPSLENVFLELTGRKLRE